MSKTDIYIMRGKSVILSVVGILLVSSGMYINTLPDNSYDYAINYENVNIKDMATANVKYKKEVEKTGIGEVIENYNKMKNAEIPQEVVLPVIEENKIEEKEETKETKKEDTKKWYLPCEMGVISGGVTYSHFALDITSPRGTNEVIYPIARGKISSIYTDYAGALIVTVNHNIDGKYYTSQYVHLSRYADNIYVGKEVGPNDPLGYMGTTGYSTGVHLHIALVDCNMYNDGSCYDLGSFFNYGRRRLTEGFYGLQSVMNVPPVWTNR
ncbi:MAG: M23 family metallopeptidase [Firmicutes bacterium]|nr:M23 family metallopeptidase [Bacillota bacterium]